MSERNDEGTMRILHKARSGNVAVVDFRVGPERVTVACNWVNDPSVSDTEELDAVVSRIIELSRIPTGTIHSATFDTMEKSQSAMDLFAEEGILDPQAKPVDRKGPQ
jgi:hypothetical protein